MRAQYLFLHITSAALLLAALMQAQAQDVPEGVGERRFELAQPVPEIHGGLFVHDLDGDGRLEFIVTSEGTVGAYSLAGEVLWVWEGPIRLFDSSHHPSAIAGELDADGEQKVAFLHAEGGIAVLDGRTGAMERTIAIEGQPEAIAIANLRGAGDADVFLQYTQTEVSAIRADTGELLWRSDEYRGIEHSPLRQADLDGDGLDELAGASIIDHDGRKLNDWDLGDVYTSMDSIAVADVVPGYPLEVVLAEQWGADSHTDVVNSDAILFRALNPWNWEDPDKVAVGDFDPERAGLEIFNRSSGGDGTAPRGREEPYANELAPWVLSAEGELITRYYVNDHKPEWWTGSGFEEIHVIDWDGDGKDELLAKERHRSGAVAVVDAITCEFLLTLPAEAERVYGVDLEGDARDEIVVLDARGWITVFWNAAGNPDPPKASRWTEQHYRRQKQNWNYYSP